MTAIRVPEEVGLVDLVAILIVVVEAVEVGFQFCKLLFVSLFGVGRLVKFCVIIIGALVDRYLLWLVVVVCQVSLDDDGFPLNVFPIFQEVCAIHAFDCEGHFEFVISIF